MSRIFNKVHVSIVKSQKDNIKYMACWAGKAKLAESCVRIDFTSYPKWSNTLLLDLNNSTYIYTETIAHCAFKCNQTISKKVETNTYS